MIRRLKHFLADTSGATAIEYALIAAGVALAIVVVVSNVGDGVEKRFTAVKDGLESQR